MAIYYKKPFLLTESEVKYVIENTRSNLEAAEFLRIGISTWKKYASMYFDPETGKSLYKMHCTVKKRGRFRTNNDYSNELTKILSGESPLRSIKRFKREIFREALFEEKCNRCGFEDRRVIDFSSPLVVTFKDGDQTNGKFDNIEIMCYNCYYLEVGKFPSGAKIQNPEFKIVE